MSSQYQEQRTVYIIYVITWPTSSDKDYTRSELREEHSTRPPRIGDMSFVYAHTHNHIGVGNVFIK